MSDLTSEVRALAYRTRNRNACSEAWPLAGVVLLVLGTKLYILGYSNELGKGLYCMSGSAFLYILETRLYYCRDVFVLWSEQVPRIFKSVLLMEGTPVLSPV